MKRDKLEQWILMEASGELSQRRRRKLDRALRGDVSLRAWREETLALLRGAHSGIDGPSANTIDAIRTFGAEHAFSGSGHALRSPFLNPAWLAAGVALLLLALGLLFFSRPSSIPQTVDTGAPTGDMSDVLAETTLDDDLDQLYALLTVEEDFTLVEEDATMDELAHELLALEEEQI